MADGGFQPDRNDERIAALYASAPDSVSFRKLRKRILRETQDAINAYRMIDDGGARPRWLVCLSGGKDSYSLLAALLDLRWQGALDADLLACNLDQGQPGFPKHVLPEFLARLGIPFRIETKDTYSIVTEKVPAGKTYCSLCSRLRRGHLYRVAREEGCSAIALGHHQGDALETFMLNLFHGGTLSAMPPKLLNEEGDLFVLRPLINCVEEDLAKFAEAMAFPIIPCDLCGSQEGLQRAAMKRMLDEWETKYPGRRATMWRALSNVRPSQLADGALFDFAALTRRIEPSAACGRGQGEGPSTWSKPSTCAPSPPPPLPQAGEGGGPASR
jgi:tRNA 2-thiocytidine biosynthesis protein TtcA